MKQAYSMIDDFSHDYLKRLYEEPIEIEYRNGKIGMSDFNNGLITHENGKKICIATSGMNKKKVWLFGDSRVSGMLIPNEYTIANLLQKKTDEFEVVNCGIPGRDIERMVYQIEKEDIKSGDLVILATGFYEFAGSYLDNIARWVSAIADAERRSRDKGAVLIYVNLPTVLEVSPWNEEEKEIINIFNKTEFTEYSIELIENCKNIIVCRCEELGIRTMDLAHCFNKRSQYGQVFINLHHYGPWGNMLIADELYERIMTYNHCNEINWDNGSKEYTITRRKFEEKLSVLSDEENRLAKYIDSVKENVEEDSVVGAVVINANPFSYGHEYLIRYALKNVDFLYVFVVSEDKSFFSYRDRAFMVASVLKKYANVKIIPSGEFCISSNTFPEYFMKDTLQDSVINIQKDVILFGSKIAKELNISKRFVGEEINDKVTQQYNIAMQRILPLYGVELVEIPRLRHDKTNNFISASTIRKCIQKKDYELLKDLVPDEVFEYIVSNY